MSYLDQIGRADILTDQNFVKESVELIQKYIARQETLQAHGYLSRRAASLIKKLGQFPENTEMLRPLYKQVFKLHFDPNVDVDLFTLNDLLGPFCVAKTFSEERTAIFQKALETSADTRLRGSSHNLIIYYFKYLKDERLRKEIISHMFSILKDAEQRHVFIQFMSVNHTPQLFQGTPIVLGVEKDLERLGQKMGAVSYKDWSNMQWVDWDSKSILSFKKTFDKVAPESSMIHFAVGAFINDLASLKESFLKIRTMEDEAALKELGNTYENYAGTRRPILNKGKVSITNLELFWIFQRPELLSKVIFYEKTEPISKEKIDKMLDALAPIVRSQ